ncbi:GNAT family N-acetyltransferase [Patulibacter sp. NPDC049589]|uniref:GNAT family N-acetyltransferase n=1 Tax=Patulibacter sp. NPDC049589 TaxID=3154731 RepID=UPI00343B33FC
MKAAAVPRATPPPPATDDPGGPPPSCHTLPDGQAILLRDVTPGDAPLLLGLLERVTGDARRLRFFTGGANLAAAAALEARCDDTDGPRLGVVALSADGGEVLGHGMCVPAGAGTAEVAFEVADGYHRRGIGTVLFAHLVGGARAAGYAELVAEVLPDNRDMRDLLTASGLAQTATTSEGIRHVRMPLGPAAPERGARA